MASEYNDSSYKASYDCISHIHRTITGGVLWYSGIIETPLGIVYVATSEPTLTHMRFYHKGRTYVRKWGKQFQPRYLTNLARKFTEDITNATP